MLCIAKYCHASGQLANFGKSNDIFNINEDLEEHSVLANTMQVNLVQNMGNYLDFPTN